MYDLYLRENVKSRPSFAPDPSEWKNETKQFSYEAKERRLFKGLRDIRFQTDGENGTFRADGRRRFVLFDYKTGTFCLAMRRHFPFPRMRYSEEWIFRERQEKEIADGGSLNICEREEM